MTKTKSKKEQSPVKEFAMLMAVPAAILLIVGLWTYIPRLLANPEYDFVYATCKNYDCDNNFVVDSDGSVSDGSVEEEPPLDIILEGNSRSIYDYPGPNTKNVSELYYHDTSEDSTRKLTLEEAQKFKLDASSKSPDGYKLEFEGSRSSGFFLLWGSSSDSGWELANGSKKKSVDVETGGYQYYYDRNLELVGWVVE